MKKILLVILVVCGGCSTVQVEKVTVRAVPNKDQIELSLEFSPKYLDNYRR
jgi:hypothetical protein